MTDDLPLSPQLRHQAGAFLSLKRASKTCQQMPRCRTTVPPPLTIMSFSPMRDLTPSHTDGAHHRREPAPKPSKEIKPLWTHEPLPHDREKKPAANAPKKRRRNLPTTPVLTFNPGRIPSGRQDPPAPSPAFSRPPTSESLASSYDEQQTTPFADREIHGQLYDGYESQKRPRIFSECPSTEHSTSSYPATPCTDINDISSVPPDLYDSPVSCTSSSSPAPSDQSPCAADIAVQVVDYPRQAPPHLSMFPYSGSQVYVSQPVVQQDSYGYPMDPCPERPPQGYPMQYFDAYGRPAPHGIPAYPDNNGYTYPPHRYYD